MMADPPVEDCHGEGKQEKIMPMRALSVVPRGQQYTGKRENGQSETHKPANGNNPADREEALQEVLTFRAAVLA
jgi:hypothetical protein